MSGPQRPATPQQARSRDTLERLLTAAESTLREKSFDEATVEEICGRAGYTVGAFYSRLRDKDALLEALEVRLMEEVERELAPLLDGDWDTDAGPEAALRQLLVSLAELYRRRGGTVRAVLERARTDPELRERIEGFNRRVVERAESSLVEALPAELDVGSHRIRTGIFFMIAALRSATLFAEAAPVHPGLGDDALCAELARACTCYLTCERDDPAIPSSPTGEDTR